MKREVIVSAQAPKAIGPYSVAIRLDNMVFCSGQIGIDPATSELVAADIESQTRQALTNLKSVLDTSGAALDTVVKTTVFLRDMADFPKVNAIYGEFFNSSPPARSTIAVAGLPKGSLVEVDAIALVK